ncbi:MAG: glutathione ABC transporter substrate-binding protein [Candidatus Velthaea sp.]
MNVTRTAAGLAGLAFVAVLSSPGALRAADTSVTISQGVDADTLNPLASTIAPTFIIVGQIYERLFEFDGPGKRKPQLAVSWKRLTPNTAEFRLRPDVHFSNGDTFTSADVKYSIDWIKDPANKSSQISYVRDIDQVETPDPLTVRFISKSPTAILPGLTNPIFIVDAKYMEAKGNAFVSQHPVGTGAYVLHEWKHDESISMDVNSAWWGGKPRIAHVVFKPIPEAAARVAALKTGETDLITNVPPQYAVSIEGGQNTRMTSVKSLRQLFIAFNTLAAGPQQNKLVRQAINYAVNVPAILKNVVGGRGYELSTALPPEYFGFDASVPGYKHDIGKAKELLAKAGFPEGKGIDWTLHCPIGRYNRDREIAEAITGQLNAIGIKTTVRAQEWTSYYNQAAHRSLEPLYMLGWAASSADADAVYTPLFESNAPLSTFKNEQVDKLIEQARYELNPRKRKALYSQIAKVVDDEAPWIFLFQYEDLYGTSKRLVWQPNSNESIRANEMSVK